MAAADTPVILQFTPAHELVALCAIGSVPVTVQQSRYPAVTSTGE